MNLRSFNFADDLSRHNAMCALGDCNSGPAGVHGVKIYLVTGPQGTGKSEFVRGCLMGLDESPTAIGKHVRSPELEKWIPGFLHQRYVWFDNIPGHFDRPCLDELLCLPIYRHRIPGTQRLAETPVNLVIFITGQNVTVSPDVQRRARWIMMGGLPVMGVRLRGKVAGGGKSMLSDFLKGPFVGRKLNPTAKK